MADRLHPAVGKVRFLPLNRPESFVSSLRAPGVQAQEFRLHHRSLQHGDAIQVPAGQRSCVVGFVLPKRLCRHAVRRNMIRRVAREGLRAWLRQADEWPEQPPVLVFKLTRKLPEAFTSARSPALRSHVRASVLELLQRYRERLQKLAARETAP
jgi:ribonuclease P protein component